MQKHPIYTVLRNTSLPLFKYFKIIIIVSEFQESHLERCGFKSWNVPAQVWSPGGKSWRQKVQKGDRIEDWEKLFRAAVVHLLTQEGGERLAISMLPAYVCRRVAEREIV